MRSAVVAIAVGLLAQTPAAPQGVSAPPASVTGQVVAADTGAPIPGAQVTATIVPLALPPGTRPPAAVRATADADGRFVISGLTPGRLNLSAAADGFVAEVYRPTSPSMPPQLNAGQALTNVTIRLSRGAVIAGIVTDERGRPLANVPVQIYRRVIFTVRRAWSEGRTPIVTDAGGRYLSQNMPPGEYVVKVPVLATTIPRSVVDALRADATSAAVRRAIENSRAPLTRAGFVTSDDYSVLLSGGMTEQPFPAIAADPGRPPRVFRTTFYPGAATLDDAGIVTLTSGQRRDDVHVRVLSSPAAQLQGTLTRGNAPAAFTGVHLIARHAAERSIDLDGEVALGVTDATGAFTLKSVPEGDYTLKVMVLTPPEPGRGTPISPPADRLAAWAARDVTMRGGDTRLDPIALLAPLSVSGELRFSGAGAGSPMAGARTTVWLATMDGGMLSPPAAVPVDQDGRFVLRGAMAGAYHLWGGNPAGWTVTSVKAEGRDITSAPIVLVDHDVTDVTIALTPRAIGISGRVLDAQGQPAANAHVVLFPADYKQWIAGGQSMRTMRHLRTSSAGTYSISGMPPGLYLVAALPDGQLDDWPDQRLFEPVAKVATMVPLLESKPLVRDLTLVQRR